MYQGIVPLMNYSDAIVSEKSVMMPTPTAAPGNQQVLNTTANNGMGVFFNPNPNAMMAPYAPPVMAQMPMQATPMYAAPCQAQKGPLENEMVQYAILFVLAFVVIKKM